MLLVLVVTIGALSGLIIGVTCAVDPMHHCLVQLLALDAKNAAPVLDVLMIFIELPLFLIVGGFIAFAGYGLTHRYRSRRRSESRQAWSYRHYMPMSTRFMMLH